ncbi:hypothetical protein ABH922_004458 [Rhodococcus sp. 27YEA15]
MFSKNSADTGKTTGLRPAHSNTSSALHCARPRPDALSGAAAHMDMTTRCGAVSASLITEAKFAAAETAPAATG